MDEERDGAALSTRLRTATAAAHREAEGTAFVDDLVAGRLTAAAHTALLRQLVPVYEALEAPGPGDGVVADLLPALARSAALRSDLQAAAGPGWADALPVLPAARAYADRVRAASASAAGWAAHAYTRYLGDLAGGQVVAAAVRRHHGVPATALSFYRFDAAPAPVLRTRFRERLDALGTSLAEDGTTALLAEAVTAFDLNAQVLRALAVAGHAPRALTPPAAAPAR